MIDVRISPPRDGTRGGQEQFTWDDVKNQHSRDRECYLGQTIKLGVVGRRGQFIKHDWYLNEKNNNEIQQDERQKEIKLIQRYEDYIMQEMLGNKPHKFLLLKNRPKTEELEKMFKEIDQSESFDNADTLNKTENITNPDVGRNDRDKSYKSRYGSYNKTRESKRPNTEDSHIERSKSFRDSRIYRDPKDYNDSYKEMKNYKKSDHHIHRGYKGRDNRDSNRETRESRDSKSEYRSSRDKNFREGYSRDDRHNRHKNRNYDNRHERVDRKLSPKRRLSQSPVRKSRN